MDQMFETRPGHRSFAVAGPNLFLLRAEHVTSFVVLDGLDDARFKHIRKKHILFG